jgi:hypothetical protein
VERVLVDSEDRCHETLGLRNGDFRQPGHASRSRAPAENKQDGVAGHGRILLETASPGGRDAWNAPYALTGAVPRDTLPTAHARRPPRWRTRMSVEGPHPLAAMGPLAVVTACRRTAGATYREPKSSSRWRFSSTRRRSSPTTTGNDAATNLHLGPNQPLPTHPLESTPKPAQRRSHSRQLSGAAAAG